MPKYLILLSGVPASGKTTLRNKVSEGTVISPDDNIGYTEDSPWTPELAKTAWKKANCALSESIDRGDNIIIFDATLVSPKVRKKYIDIGRKNSIKLVSICCLASKEQITKRNANRDKFRKVPRNVIDRMMDNLVYPSKEEGFDYVVFYNSENNRFSGDVEILKVIGGLS